MCRVLTIGLLIGFLVPNVAVAQRGFFQRQSHHQHHHHCPHCQQQQSGLATVPMMVEGTDASASVVATTPDSFNSPFVPANAIAQEQQAEVAQPATKLEADAVVKQPQSWQGRLFANETFENVNLCVAPQTQAAQGGMIVNEIRDDSQNAIVLAARQPQLWEGRMFADESRDDSQDAIVCAAPQTKSQATAAEDSDTVGLGWLLPFGLLPLGWLGLLALTNRGPRGHAAEYGGTAAKVATAGQAGQAVQPVNRVATAAIAEDAKADFVKDDFESGVLKNGAWETTGATSDEAAQGTQTTYEPVVQSGRAQPAATTEGYGSLGTCRPCRPTTAAASSVPVEVNERTDCQDDYTVIEGICPKAERLLYDAKINSYTDLAETDDECRMKAMIPGGSRFSSKDTRHWPEAARELIPVEEPQEANEYGSAASERDDLTMIEGICPEAQQLLYDAGIYRYSDVATTDTKTFANALACGGTRFESVDTSRWSNDAEACVATEFDPVFLRFGAEEATLRSQADACGDSWFAEETSDNIQLDDLTKIDTVDEDAQQAFYSAGIFEYGDLAAADRDSLKRSMVQYDDKYASFDVGHCCDEAMNFVSGDFAQNEESEENEELELVSEVDDTDREETGSNSWWNGVTARVKRGSSAFTAKLEELDGNAEHLLNRDLSDSMTTRFTNAVADRVKRGNAAFASKLKELDGGAAWQRRSQAVELAKESADGTQLGDLAKIRLKSYWDVVSDGVMRGSEKVSAKMNGIGAQLRSYASDSDDAQLGDVSSGRNERDDLTKIDSVDGELQQAIYSAGVFQYGDLAVADRDALKRSMTQYDSKYASFDVDRCCDQAMHFVPEDFWQGEELRVLSEVNDLSEEMTRFKSLWSVVTDRVKRGSKQVFAKIGGKE